MPFAAVAKAQIRDALAIWTLNTGELPSAGAVPPVCAVVTVYHVRPYGLTEPLLDQARRLF